MTQHESASRYGEAAMLGRRRLRRVGPCVSGLSSRQCRARRGALAAVPTVAELCDAAPLVRGGRS